jgi:hypothetical protein
MKRLGRLRHDHDEPEEVSPIQEILEGRFPEDALLRRNGYRVVSRHPKVLWQLPGGEPVTHEQALAQLPTEELKLIR